MNAPVDISSIVAAVKPAEIVALEAQLEQAQASLRIVYRNLAIEQENASAAYQSSMKVKNASTMAAAAKKAATLQATATALEKTSRKIRREIETARPAVVAAIHAALAPLRNQAVSEISDAKAALYAALAKYNATAQALDQPVMPASIPVLDHILDRVGKAI